MKSYTNILGKVNQPIKKLITTSLSLLVFSIVNAQHPGGVKAPCVWFQTEPVDTTDLNGTYKWKDHADGNSMLHSMDSEEETTASRSEINTYNFNPALPFDSTVSQECTVKGFNLAQKTIVAVVGAKKAEATSDGFVYHIESQNSDDAPSARSLCKTRVIHHTSQGTTSYNYNPHLQQTDKTLSERVKIVSYLEAQQPQYTIWKNAQSAQINFGKPLSEQFSSDNNSESNGENNLSASNYYSPELVVYPRYLRPQERLRVESYLALKYGITLKGSYIDPKCNIIWKGDNTYAYRITGYGRDDRSSLNQTIATTSYEENADDVDDTYHKGDSNNESSAYNLIVMGFMEATDVPDHCYVIYGDNNQMTSVKEIDQPIDSVDYTDTLKVMMRVWKVVCHGIDSTYTHQLELGYNMTKDSAFADYRNDNVYMLIDRSGNGDFQTDVDTIRMSGMDEERGKIIFSDFHLDSLCHFTFGYAGVPLEEPEPKVYDYYLELTDPTCNGYEGRKDGEVKLLLPENENGFYYSYQQSSSGGATLEIAFDSILQTNQGHGEYVLKILPVGSESIEFEGTGVTLINLMFNNNEGSAEWTVDDVEKESQVAFVDHNLTDTKTSEFMYGVKIVGSKLYVINNKSVGNAICEVENGDKITLQRVNQEVKILVNNVVKNSIQIAIGNSFKLGVYTEEGNISDLILEHFNWNGNFPNIFFDQYQNQKPLVCANENVRANIKGYMVFDIDFDDYCWDSTKGGDSELTLTTYQGERKFDVTLTLDYATDVTFYVYNTNGVLICKEESYVDNKPLTKSFSMNAPGQYMVVAITTNGNKYSSETVLK